MRHSTAASARLGDASTATTPPVIIELPQTTADAAACSLVPRTATTLRHAARRQATRTSHTTDVSDGRGTGLRSAVMNDAANTHAAWLAQVHEEALEPELPICDAHHHLWLDEGHTGWPYTLDDLHRDTGSGHNVVRTVFLECGAQYRTEGPAAFRPVGETEFVAAAAQASVASGGAEIAAIVSSADLLDDSLDAVLDAHDAAGGGRFRGIRYITAQDEYKPLAMSTPPGVMQNDRYLAGVRRLGARGLTYDTCATSTRSPSSSPSPGPART